MSAGTIEATGLEIDGRVEVTETLSIRAGVSVTDARLDGGVAAPQLTGLRPAQAPAWSAVGGVDWLATDRLTLAADLRWESRRFEDDLNSRELEAAATADFRAEWALSADTLFWLAADNLFDTEVEVSETATGVAGFGPPRTFSLGVRLSR
jgi:outer membrane receptor protein involved in Fe transport